MRLRILFLIIFIGFHAYSQDLDGILKMNIHERGGEDKLLKLNSYLIEGTLTTSEGEVPATIRMKHKVGYIFEFEVKGFKNYILINSAGGKRLIVALGSKEPKQMDYEEYVNYKSLMNIYGDLESTHSKDHVLEYSGEFDIEGTSCHLIQCRTHGVGSPHPKKIYVSNAPVRVVKESFILNSNEGEIEKSIMYSDYKMTPEGYLFPMKIKNFLGEFNVRSIKINPKFEDHIFLGLNHKLQNKK